MNQLQALSKNNNHDEDEDDENKETTTDWRKFRAKLVGASTYDAGTLIEKGSIVLSQVEDTLGCHDLNQPYLHKAVVLVLDHYCNNNNEKERDDYFTKGILLNRPTDLVLSDEDIVYVDDQGNQLHNQPQLGQQEGDSNAGLSTTINSNNKWPIYFGGDLAGLFDEQEQPMIVCLHRRRKGKLQSGEESNNDDNIANNNDTDFDRTHRDVVDENAILSDICMISHADACVMIAAGQAQPGDFFMFYGFCGWEPGQLLREINRGSWTMVTSDAETVWNALERQTRDPRAGGIEMWETFANMIGKDYKKGQGSFSDLMLKSWASEMLCVAREHEEDNSYEDADIQRALDVAAEGPDIVEPGMLIRASSIPSRYLLNEQYLHKSIILVLHESDDASVGLVLNIPTSDSITLDTPGGKKVDFTIRYGGASGVSGEDPLIWLHCSRALRKLGIGNAIDSDISSQVWVCTVDQVMEALDLGLALPREFLVIQGFSAWEKQQHGSAGGIVGQLRSGNLELVSSRLVENVWTLLQSQDSLTEETLDLNIQNSFHAWTIAGLESQRKAEDKDGFIFESDIHISDLTDVALQAWMRIFLLGDAEYAPS